MANVDAVMADKRAADVIEKYRKRIAEWVDSEDNPDDPDGSHAHTALTTELQSDIANAINAAVSEAVAAQPVHENGKDEPHERRARPATTHMPATGHDKPSARK